jgi:transcriptional regulator with XRE-family HTH domain
LSERRRDKTQSALGEKKRRALALIELGDLLKNRRKGDLRMSQQEVADSVGCTQGFYAELEAGTRSSKDIRLWLRIAEALQLAPKRVLRFVWEARGSLPVALPVRGETRDALLELAIQQSAAGVANGD